VGNLKLDTEKMQRRSFTLAPGDMERLRAFAKKWNLRNSSAALRVLISKGVLDDIDIVPEKYCLRRGLSNMVAFGG
jgi:hypothetical protein